MGTEKQLSKNKLFFNLTEEQKIDLEEASNILTLNQGQVVIRQGKFETHAFMVLEGSLRILTQEVFGKELCTIGFAGKNEIVGITDLLLNDPIEAVIAREPTQVLCIPLKNLITLMKNNAMFRKDVNGIQSISEGARALKKYLQRTEIPPEEPDNWLKNQLRNYRKEQNFDKLDNSYYLLS